MTKTLGRIAFDSVLSVMLARPGIEPAQYDEWEATPADSRAAFNASARAIITHAAAILRARGEAATTYQVQAALNAAADELESLP